MRALPRNSNLPVLMKSRTFCQTAEVLFFFFCEFFLAAEHSHPHPLHPVCWVLSITHAIAASCLKLITVRPWMPSLPSPHPHHLPSLPPHQPVIHSSTLTARPVPPPGLSSLLAVSRLLFSMHFTDTPTETSDLMSGQEVKGFKWLLWE